MSYHGRILVAEDDFALGKAYERILLAHGYRVLRAIDGLEAFEQYLAANKRGETPDIVLTDGNMPQMDGVELTSWMLAQQIPVVMITGNCNLAARMPSVFPGLRVLNKPVNMTLLIQTLEEARKSAVPSQVAPLETLASHRT